ncbi:hypothetical protein K402DRAFT_392607 [Aulographum hederae CBS 113979]|uniref:Uncharacterized protein n=1 Tax=Aulographum hederae CBS 113979 TaxID=1176131 RepID=A0A6G1H3M2_9PEZI|nr:hypothetical protein K402DRAFT_392607 [Aulographum hederae CBS 113979]
MRIHKIQVLAVVVALAAGAHAQTLSDAPNLSAAQSENSQAAESTTARPSSTNDDPTTTRQSAAASTPTSDAAVTNAPALSTSTQAPTRTNSDPTTTFGGLTDLPTIAGALNPTPQVPWTAGAPFMNRSKLPEGTVFIAVGAILGFCGLAILAWRGLVAWSLHRSVKRSTHAHYSNLNANPEKATLRKKHKEDERRRGKDPSLPEAFYNAVDRESNLSIDRLAQSEANQQSSAGRRHHKQSRPSHSDRLGSSHGATSRQTGNNLFFSPTAGAGSHVAPTSTPASARNSTYLPSGYYAQGASTAAGGANTVTTGSSAVDPRSSAYLNPHARPVQHHGSSGYSRNSSVGPSPPDSPGLHPTMRASYYGPGTGATSSVAGHAGNGGLYGQSGISSGSGSSINLNVPGGTATGGRTPSAYLDDLLDNHGSLGGYDGHGGQSQGQNQGQNQGQGQQRGGHRRSESRGRY